MKDRPSRLDGLLRSLPRERASDDFRQRVLRAARRAEAERGRVSWAPRVVPAMVAAALLLALGLSLGLYMMERARRAELRREIAELRREHERLDFEVEQLRQEARTMGAEATGRRVIYLGGDDTVDYVLDLERLARRGQGGRLIPAASAAMAPYSGGEL